MTQKRKTLNNFNYYRYFWGAVRSIFVYGLSASLLFTSFSPELVYAANKRANPDTVVIKGTQRWTHAGTKRNYETIKVHDPKGLVEIINSDHKEKPHGLGFKGDREFNIILGVWPQVVRDTVDKYKTRTVYRNLPVKQEYKPSQAPLTQQPSYDTKSTEIRPRREGLEGVVTSRPIPYQSRWNNNFPYFILGGLLLGGILGIANSGRDRNTTIIYGPKSHHNNNINNHNNNGHKGKGK